MYKSVNVRNVELRRKSKQDNNKGIGRLIRRKHVCSGMRYQRDLPFSGAKHSTVVKLLCNLEASVSFVRHVTTTTRTTFNV